MPCCLTAPRPGKNVERCKLGDLGYHINAVATALLVTKKDPARPYTAAFRRGCRYSGTGSSVVRALFLFTAFFNLVFEMCLCVTDVAVLFMRITACALERSLKAKKGRGHGRDENAKVENKGNDAGAPAELRSVR